MTYGRKPKFVVKRVKEIQRHAAVSQALPAFVDYHRCGLTPSAARCPKFQHSRRASTTNGVHGARAVSGSATLTRGVHEIKVEYFQGPRFTVALVLAVSPPGKRWRIFNVAHFQYGRFQATQ